MEAAAAHACQDRQAQQTSSVLTLSLCTLHDVLQLPWQARRLLESPVSAGNAEKTPVTPQQQAVREAAAAHAAKIAQRRAGAVSILHPMR